MPSYCQTCHAALPENTAFCLHCGAFAPLDVGEFGPAGVAEEPDSVFATCAACNTPLNSNTGVCPVCFPSAPSVPSLPALPPMPPLFPSGPEAASAVTASLLPPVVGGVEDDFVLQDLPLPGPRGSDSVVLKLEVEPASGPTAPSLPELPRMAPSGRGRKTARSLDEDEETSPRTLPMQRAGDPPPRNHPARPTSTRGRPTAPEKPPAVPVEPFRPPELDPTQDYLLQLAPGGRYKAWDLRRPYYSIGRERCKILLEDRCVSRRHAVVVRAGATWLCVNLSDKKMRVNGWELRQRRLADGDVIRVGDTWLVYQAASNPPTMTPLRLMGGSWPRSLGLPTAIPAPAPAPPSATTLCTLLSGATVLAASRGEPLLIGSHPVCDVVLGGPDVAPVHALLNWMPVGLLAFDAGSGLPLRLDGHPVKRDPVMSGQTLRVGSHKITVRVSGDPAEPGRARLQRLKDTPPELWLSAIYGPHAGETTPLSAERSVVLGKELGLDLVLPRDPELVPFRLEFRVRPGRGETRTVAHEAHVRQVADPRPVVINRVPMEQVGKMKAGDVMQFGTPEKVGPTTLLVHYDPRAEEW